MIYNSKLKITAAILAAAIALGGCAAKPGDTPLATVSMEPASTPVITQTPKTPSPTTIATESLAPSAIETPGATGGIPPDIERFLLNYSYDDVEPFNMLFSESTSADMDGDGREETIGLIPEETEVFGEEEFYTAVKVQIGNKEITLKANPGWNFGYADVAISGTILDFDREDGAKELLLTQNNDVGDEADSAVESVIVSYRAAEPRVLMKLGFYPEATGTGYILGSKYTKELEGGYSIAIQPYLRYLDDHFDEIETETVKTLSYTSFAPEQEDGYPTIWDQKVAKQPGDETVDTIKAGTAVYFGMYHQDGWIELHDREGTTQGWLDLNMVDIDKYIGYALQVSCH